MSLKRYNRLKKQYRRQHGENPPKGTKLAQLEKMLGTPSTSGSSQSVPTSSSGQSTLFSQNFTRGGWR